MRFAGGIDFIKDDELQANGPHCPFAERFTKVFQVIKRHAEQTGRKVMYACNITGEIDEMLERQELVAESGGTCVMVSLNSAGLPALVALRRSAKTAIPWASQRLGHLQPVPSYRNELHRLSSSGAWRVDHLHVNGLSNKFCEADESVIASARECLKPMFEAPARGFEIMPVFSSGQSVKQAPATWAALGSSDLIYALSMGHHGASGIAAGCRRFTRLGRQRWLVSR